MEEHGFFGEPKNWVFIAFVLFFVLFGRKLWSALAGMLDDRASKVRAELEEALPPPPGGRRRCCAMPKPAARTRCAMRRR